MCLLKQILIVDGGDDYVNDLIKAIRNGSTAAAERAVKQLAKNRTKIQFLLSNPHEADDQKSNKKTKTSASNGSSDILKFVYILFTYPSFISRCRFQLQVESHLDRDPLNETIYVRNGTSLYDLKDQVGVHLKSVSNENISIKFFRSKSK